MRPGGRLEVHAQGAFDRNLEKAELPVLEDAGDDAGLGLTVDRHFGRLVILVVAIDAGQVVDLLLGDLVALVVEALLHLLEEARAVDELHLAAPLRWLAVRHEPDIGEDAGVCRKAGRVAPRWHRASLSR